MENLSVEILDIIFEYLPSLNDIQNCVKTCTKWNKIIRRKFQNKAKVLVATGANDSIKKVGTNIEIIDLIDYSVETFILKDSRANRFDAIGTLVHDQPVIIGGAYDWGREDRATEDGFIIGQHQRSLNLLQGRDRSASVVLKENTLLITGGLGRIRNAGDVGGLNSMELISAPLAPSLTWPLHVDLGPELPFTIHEHSMVKVADNAVFLIGGCGKMKPEVTNGMFGGTTWKIDPTDNFKITEGPSLHSRRNSWWPKPACGQMKINGRIFLVACGHWNWPDSNSFKMDSLDGNSLKLLDTSLPDQNWIDGPPLPGPYKYFGSTMITSPTGKGVILIGGLRKKLTRSANEERMNPEIHSNELIELSGDSLDSLQWTVLKQKLVYPRKDHVSFLIPNEVASKLSSSEFTN